MPYTTQGYMTQADMEDMADLYDWNAGAQEAQAEEEAMEAAHAAHADECRACQEDASLRETGARVALAMDDARRALDAGIQEALGLWKAQGIALPPLARKALEEAQAKARAALRSI